MKWFVGVDGGGSKTEIAVADEHGAVAVTKRFAGCSYQMLGIDAAVERIVSGIEECLTLVNADLSCCAGCGIGVPCYGESAQNDTAIAAALTRALSPVPLYITNDVEVAWAGAGECSEGIHIVAGTGSIAFGRSSSGETARCGGWNEFFGDEGSCYWAGRQAMSLFSKEADGRAPQSALYEIVRGELGLADDYQFIDKVLSDWAPHRDKVALFQRFMQQAAEQGDHAAAAIYETAATELSSMAGALVKRLGLPAATRVSYSGGLFKAGKLILEPLDKLISDLGCTLQEPRRTAAEGAIILAIEYTNGRII